MAQYIALLRGINVGGRVLKMDKLKEYLTVLAFKNITTYIQSGNVIFESDEKAAGVLKNKIEGKLLKGLGYHVALFIKTPSEFEEVITNNPFQKKDEEKDVEVYITFLSKEINEKESKALQPMKDEVEDYKIVGSIIYCLFKKHTYGKSKFSNNYLEKKLGQAATTRNLNSVKKIPELTRGK